MSKKNLLLTLSVGSAAIATITYALMNFTHIDQGTKWSLFGIHLMTTCVGLIIGGLAILKRYWVSVFPVLVCGAFFYLQVLS